ncbi:MAG: hypothetical protein HCAMLNBO_02549 [Candidatus Brocadia fulgida]|nr:hypothetical protein [Candidatus Brocadia fulgida]
MPSEKRRMIGKEYGLNTFVEEGERIPDKRYGVEITEKTVDEINEIRLKCDRIDVGGDGYGVKPAYTLLGEQEA